IRRMYPPPRSVKMEAAKPSNRWTAEEEKNLIEAIKNGKTPADIAGTNGRTESAIKDRLKKLWDGKTAEEVSTSTGIQIDIVKRYIRKPRNAEKECNSSGSDEDES